MALPFNVPDELKAMQVDPIHTANVLASMLGSIGSPETDPTTGLPSVSNQGPTTNTAQPNTIEDVTTAGGSQGTTTPGTTAGAETFPLEGGNAPISQPFGGPRGHPGIDFGVPVGSHAVAAIDGQVTVAGNTDPGGYGNEVEITNGNTVVRYGHLSGIGVKLGQQVHAGQSLGETGGVAGAPGSGNSEGPHLHFEVRVNGQAVDPAPLLAGGASVVGMPTSDTSATPGTPTADPTPISPEQIIAAQLANVTDTIAGKAPGHDVSQQATAPKADTTPGGGTGDTPGAPGAASGSWANDILAGIGAPVTPETLALMNNWINHEGGAVHNNPLNTALDMPGATNWNDLGGGMHVKTYVDYQQGLTATIRTLLQSNMAGIAAALRSGNAAAAKAAIGSSPWGTHNL